MMAAPGTGGWPSATSTGISPAGLSSRNSSRRSQNRSSIQARFDAVFAEHQAHIARERAERLMEQRQHGFPGMRLGRAAGIGRRTIETTALEQ